MGAEENLAITRRGFELFNAGDLDTLFAEVFHPQAEYHGDPDISALAGFPADHSSVEAVRKVWTAFFAMFEEITLSDVELIADDEDRVFGTAHMVSRGGSSEVPIDALFHFAWVLRDGRWRFAAVKLDRGAVAESLAAWEAKQA